MPVTFSASNAAGTLSRTRTFSVSDADLLRIIDVFNDVPVSPANPAGGTLTNTQATDAWLAWLMTQTKAKVLAAEQAKAAASQAEITAT